MADGSHVDDKVLGSEILVDRLWSLWTLFLLSREGTGDVVGWVDHCKHFVVHLIHHKSADAFNRKVEVIDEVSLLIEVGRLSEELLLEARADKGQETLIPDGREQVELLKALFVDLLADFEPQVHGEFLDEVVKCRIVRLAIVLECLANVKVELV